MDDLSGVGRRIRDARCPACGSTTVVRFVYGLQGPGEPGEAALAARPHQTDWVCRACGHEWQDGGDGRSAAVEVPAIVLPSGLRIERPFRRLARLGVLYPYYDGVASANPYEIEPIDVVVTVSVNSFLDTPDLIRDVHLDLAAACAEALGRIPPDADLRTCDDATLDALRDLLVAAVRVPNVALARATKVLHRKRPNLLPMLDCVLLEHYLSGPEHIAELEATVEPAPAAVAADSAMETLRGFRADLAASADALGALCCSLAGRGIRVTPVRVLEFLVWSEVEPSGHFRAGSPEVAAA